MRARMTRTHTSALRLGRGRARAPGRPGAPKILLKKAGKTVQVLLGESNKARNKLTSRFAPRACRRVCARVGACARVGVCARVLCNDAKKRRKFPGPGAWAGRGLNLAHGLRGADIVYQKPAHIGTPRPRLRATGQNMRCGRCTATQPLSLSARGSGWRDNPQLSSAATTLSQPQRSGRSAYSEPNRLKPEASL